MSCYGWEKKREGKSTKYAIGLSKGKPRGRERTSGERIVFLVLWGVVCVH